MQTILKRDFKTVQVEVPSRDDAIYFAHDVITLVTPGELEEIRTLRPDVFSALDILEEKPMSARSARKIAQAEAAEKKPAFERGEIADKKAYKKAIDSGAIKSTKSQKKKGS